MMGFTRGMGSHSGIPAPGSQCVPIEQALAGLEVHPLEEGETAIEAFVLVKTLDAEGETTWLTERRTGSTVRNSWGP